MSAVFFAAIACITALMALSGEWAIGIKERRVRAVLEQPLNREGKEKQRFYQILFFTSILALFLALAQALAFHQFVRPIQGVAVVLDTAAGPADGEASRQLSIEKGVATELIRALPGVTLSLYELRGGSVHLVVPPTIDRLFFELQADGILPSPSTVNDLSIASIQKDIVGRFSGPPPWVVVISPMKMQARGEDLDGVATIGVQKNTVACTVFEAGLSFTGLSVKNAALKIGERLSRSPVPTAPDSMERFLLVLSTGLAFVCFVVWRKVKVPLFALGMVLLACPQAFSVTDVEANAMVRTAADLAEAKDFDGGSRVVEELLTTVSQPQARQKLLYDRALLSYLQGKLSDALVWLDMQASAENEQPMAEAQTLRGLALTRLVETTADSGERVQRKELLRKWIEGKPTVSPEVIAKATIALVSPSMDVTDVESVRRTLRWLEENAEGGLSTPLSPLVLSASFLMEEIKTGVVQELKATWPKSIVTLFSSSTPQRTISETRIWYDFAHAPSHNEAVAFLLDQASMSSHVAICFPKQRADANADLTLVSSILDMTLLALPEQRQRFLKWLLGKPTGDGELRAAMWYSRALLWPLMLADGPERLKSVCDLLCHEIDVPSSALARKTLATLIASICSLPGTSMEEDPLQGVFKKTLDLWYVQDPEDALETVLAFTDKDPKRWSPRLFSLIMPYLKTARSGERSAPSVMAHSVGDDLSVFDPVLTGRLWQVSQGRDDTPQDVRRDVDHLSSLFSELLPRIHQPSDPTLRSLVLIYSLQPLVFSRLRDAPIFHNNSQKRDMYDQLLQEWNASCVAVQQRIEDSSTFRLPKVRQEVKSSVTILSRLQALLRGSEEAPAALESSQIRPSASGSSSSVRGEDAVRLFQEMDRSDRELYGE